MNQNINIRAITFRVVYMTFMCVGFTFTAQQNVMLNLAGMSLLTMGNAFLILDVRSLAFFLERKEATESTGQALKRLLLTQSTLELLTKHHEMIAEEKRRAEIAQAQAEVQEINQEYEDALRDFIVENPKGFTAAMTLLEKGDLNGAHGKIKEVEARRKKAQEAQAISREHQAIDIRREAGRTLRPNFLAHVDEYLNKKAVDTARQVLRFYQRVETLEREAVELDVVADIGVIFNANKEDPIRAGHELLERVRAERHLREKARTAGCASEVADFLSRHDIVGAQLSLRRAEERTSLTEQVAKLRDRIAALPASATVEARAALDTLGAEATNRDMRKALHDAEQALAPITARKR